MNTLETKQQPRTSADAKAFYWKWLCTPELLTSEHFCFSASQHFCFPAALVGFLGFLFVGCWFCFFFAITGLRKIELLIIKTKSLFHVVSSPRKSSSEPDSDILIF